MNTYNTAQWCDYVRGLVSPPTLQAMQQALASDRHARRTSSLLGRVARVGHQDRYREIPPYALRIAKAAGSLRRSETAATLLSRQPFTVLFDSLVHGLAGTREIQAAYQQMLYRSEPFTVEFRLEQETGPQSQIVIGQLLRHEETTEPVVDVPVLVLSDGKVVARDVTTRFGEFQAAGLPIEPLQLCLLVQSDSCIELPLGSVE